MGYEMKGVYVQQMYNSIHRVDHWIGIKGTFTPASPSPSPSVSFSPESLEIPVCHLDVHLSLARHGDGHWILAVSLSSYGV
jgi:hypothetical protein